MIPFAPVQLVQGTINKESVMLLVRNPVRRLQFVWLFAGLALASHAAPALALKHVLPESGDAVIGQVVISATVYEDTFAALAERYSLGYQKLIDANPEVDPWLPGEGTPITLPFKHVLPEIDRQGIVINLPEYRLYYFLPDGTYVATFAIGIGREEFPTPIVDTRIITRIENPSWTPTPVARREYRAAGTILPPVVPPGPDNPLGPLAIQLGIPGYFIHGTNRPFGVGQRASQGCIRLYNDEIRELVKLAPNGTRVRTISQPYKTGWRAGELFLEVHRPLEGDVDVAAVKALVKTSLANRDATIDWAEVEAVALAARGVPAAVARDQNSRAATTAAR
jgi:L,D-transpeptidase ErfK/SrfK